MPYPIHRLRRLRQNKILRRLVQEVALSVNQFVYPLFVRPGKGIRKEVPSMPGVFQFSIDQVLKEIKEAVSLGIPAFLLFGIPTSKNAQGTEAYGSGGIVQKAVRAIKKEFPEILVITDVCLCEYMDHGHCGTLKDQNSKFKIQNLKEVIIDNDLTLKLLQKTALSHVESGADIVAPSGMMDGMVQSIRMALDQKGFQDTPILSYAAKFASGFYGPFRDAAESPPQFGDRKSYQMPFSNREEALREIALDIEEGADMVMVKPALAYLDIIRDIREKFHIPVAAYHVSGEYSMVKAAHEKGWLSEKEIVLEILTASRRAGAHILITYWAKDVAKWFKAR